MTGSEFSAAPRAAGPGWREFASVAVGGMLGTAARLLIDTVMPQGAAGGALVVNVVGSFVLGLLVGFAPRLPRWLHAGLTIGALGSFTTFSAVLVAAQQQAASGSLLGTIAYLGAMLLLGLSVAAAGVTVGGRRARRAVR